MCATENPPAPAEVLDVRHLRLTEVPEPHLPPAERAARDRVWDEAARANPRLFDGPVAACAGLERRSGDTLVLSWVRTTYRHYALRRVPGATARLPSLFTGVLQPTDDGRLLLGRMASWTAAPGRWQPPAGTAEPPEEGSVLDALALRRHAARELAEEAGVDTPPGELTLWGATRGGNGSVGVLFLAPARPAAVLRERFAAVCEAEESLGRAPELDRVAFVAGPAGLAGLEGPHVDFLGPVLHRWAADGPLRSG
ncbi:NUDIX hydrolase [Streptomyces sp. TR06-5]|uniref:NUDIX hydrolase n=1 Tax=unclassified Streptomyces TaxID=2593676 RepID=UPI0039A1F563